MTNTTTVVLLVAVLLSYGFLVFSRRRDFWYLWVTAFVVASVGLRLSIDVVDVRDFSPYFASFLTVKQGAIPAELLFEPYRLVVFEVTLFFGDFESMSQITAIYYFHFALVTAFFVWLASQREITFELKLILFMAFYPTIAFVWLRAGVGYVAACWLMFSITQGKWKNAHLMLPLVHASTFPIVLVTKIKDLKFLQKVMIMLAAIVAGYFVLESGSSYVQYLSYKVERYSETSIRRTSVNLLLFNVANILLYLYLCVINPVFRQSFIVQVTMGASVIVYLVNPVMGLRMFPFVLIAAIVERISFPRHKLLTLLVCAGYVPIYYARFDQIFLV